MCQSLRGVVSEHGCRRGRRGGWLVAVIIQKGLSAMLPALAPRATTSSAAALAPRVTASPATAPIGPRLPALSWPAPARPVLILRARWKPHAREGCP
ncbi:hypothetical protein COLSTE_00336 [Collinsella stercoris DSM 13279]|uniref:Uncharacterized protein n=1 Tax=Collinsella stercoris DSM 13279 TaxID=445975 RepID=B6G8F8_9ACTN|nr:hypothetical protein COLSTE_00336 [Collinsella stercoris DSM 13279]